MRSRLLALALLLVAPFVSAEPLDLTNAKNEEAATVLIARFFENIGLDVFRKGDTDFGLKAGGYRMMIVTYFNPDDGCRLNAYITYKGRKENIGNAKLQSLVNEINDSYNYLVLSVSDKGDLSFRFTLLFDKKLEAKVVHRWLRLIERQTDAAMEEHMEKLQHFQAPEEK